VEYQLRGSFLDLFRCDLIQKCNRIVINLAPEMWVQVGEEAKDFWMPCPPEILSQRKKPFMKRRV
jgi:hypothetical protein